MRRRKKGQRKKFDYSKNILLAEIWLPK